MLRVDIGSGLLDEARQVPSPNCDERPTAAVVELVVVHGISLPPGEYGGGWVEALFTNRLDPAAHPYFAEIADLRVSAHLLIDREGQVTQFVPLNRRAWHAGASCFQGRERCNDFAVGIELEGEDEIPYTDAQYARLAEVIAALCEAYPALTAERIVGHADIAPGRKTDPGPAFDWDHLHRLLAGRAGARDQGTGIRDSKPET